MQRKHFLKLGFAERAHVSRSGTRETGTYGRRGGRREPQQVQDLFLGEDKSAARIQLGPVPARPRKHQRKVAAKGYRRAAPSDFMLALTVGKRQKVDLDTWHHYGYRDAYTRTEGEVALDAFDAKTKKALWHGKITDIINPKKPDPAKADAALTKLLERFPSK